MALVDLWTSDRDQIAGKRLDQLIAFAGEGRLLDGNSTSLELRTLLSVVPSDLINRWLEECLENRFQDFGFVLQDIINEIGHRLGFDVSHGVYRSHSHSGFDGLWKLPSGRAIIVESKSSTAYSINLNRIAAYRKQVAPSLNTQPDEVSILIVVGTEDTNELEAQVRGSRFAWDVRLLGARSLFRLLKLKETLDDPDVERQIHEILVPQEFTRLDRIIDLVFATAEDAKQTSDAPADEPIEEATSAVPRASFHASILPRLEKHFDSPLVKRSRVQWTTPDEKVLLSCQVSKEFTRSDLTYWFGLKRTTKEAIEQHCNSYCAFGLGSPERVALLPFNFLFPLLSGFYTSPEPDGEVRHWHIRIAREGERIYLLDCPNQQRREITQYLLK